MVGGTPKYYEGHDRPVNLGELEPAEKAYLDFIIQVGKGEVEYTPEAGKAHRISEIRKVMIRDAFFERIDAI